MAPGNGMQTKIATCCYCGTRAALTLSGTGRRELACSSCGAPLHDLKGFKAQISPDAVRARRPKTPPPDWLKPKPGRRTRKRRKPLGRRLLSEAFDLIEDILD